jgi:hypothetical protein
MPVKKELFCLRNDLRDLLWPQTVEKGKAYNAPAETICVWQSPAIVLVFEIGT